MTRAVVVKGNKDYCSVKNLSDRTLDYCCLVYHWYLHQLSIGLLLPSLLLMMLLLRWDDFSLLGSAGLNQFIDAIFYRLWVLSHYFSDQTLDCCCPVCRWYLWQSIPGLLLLFFININIRINLYVFKLNFWIILICKGYFFFNNKNNKIFYSSVGHVEPRKYLPSVVKYSRDMNFIYF
jgi:hypothetical protein